MARNQKYDVTLKKTLQSSCRSSPGQYEQDTCYQTRQPSMDLQIRQKFGRCINRYML